MRVTKVAGAFLAAVSIVSLGVMYLYGVIGPPPTPAGPVVIAPRAEPLFDGPREEGEPFRILLVGTSLMARGSWHEKIEAALSRCTTHGVEVSKLAKSGASIRWGLPALEARFANSSLPLPDIVVAEFNGNDASPHRGLPLFLSRSRTHKMIDLIRRVGAVPFLSTMNPGWGEEAVTRPGQFRYHGNYRDLAKETGIGLIDTAQLWVALTESERQRLVPDGGHPTSEGMERIAIPAFLEALRPQICD